MIIFFIIKSVKEISSQMENLMSANYELRVRNEELEKENKRLHETILKLSQKQIKGMMGEIKFLLLYPSSKTLIHNICDTYKIILSTSK